MKAYLSDVQRVLDECKSTEHGLHSEEAASRLTRDGKNKLSEGQKDSIAKRFIKQLMDPMIIILLVAAAVSGVLAVYEGESFADVIIILAVVIVNAALGVYQESKAEKAIEALQQMSASTSKVLRDGQVRVIKSEDLVVGDVVILEAGDAVPADGRIIECASLKVEEAALTGESVPVGKFINLINLADSSKDVPLGDRKNMAYMGSTIAYGRGAMVVTASGMNTEMGKIADALANVQEGKTPLQIKLHGLSKTLTWLVLGICVVIFAVQIIRAGGFSAHVTISSFMIAVSLAVAAIPEGLAAVVTVVLSIGVTNMSKRNAIIRRLTAVETLGCAQVICSDKTGTLTQNKMTVVDSFGSDKHLIARAMALCTDAEINEDGSETGDPTEIALVAWAAKLSYKKTEMKEQLPRVGEAPFDSDRKMMSTVHRNNTMFIQYTKGAPDEILKQCTQIFHDGHVIELTEQGRQEILAANKGMADKALRVLAVAQRTYENKPTAFDTNVLEHELCFIGLCGMIDPVRPEVRDAIVECKSAGIRAIMITGDHVDTAGAIARELGILDGGKLAITGAQLADMDNAEFASKLESIAVYARVQPEHKTRIVNAWRDAGYVTAMTGDGVNDAPSIKSADIGIGMGITGTDVTKNVADMVLADDNFATIVSAVEEGRRIYDNIRKSIQFLLSSNMSEVICIFVATLLGFTILKPVHLLWINLITDCFPALALGMEKGESDLMQRKPRSAKAGIFADGMSFDIGYQGCMVAVLTLSSYFIGHYLEVGVWEIAESPHGITMAFLTMSMAEIFHSFNMRSQHCSIWSLKSSNKALNFAAIGSLIATTVVCEVPFLVDAFDFVPVDWDQYLLAIGIGFCVIPIVELVKWVQRRKHNCNC